jgi:hypothetical protein
MYGVRLCRSDFNIIARQIRISCPSVKMCCDRVRVSTHFGKEITLWNNYRVEDRMHHLDGSIRQCVQSGINKSKFPFATFAVIMFFYFTSQSSVWWLDTCISRQYWNLLLYSRINTRSR